MSETIPDAPMAQRSTPPEGAGSETAGLDAPELAGFLTAYAGLAEQLAASARRHAVSEGERLRLRSEIATLFRRVDRQLVLLTALREDVRSLAGSWKRLPRPAPVTAMTAPVPLVARGEATTRVDHLGASTFVAKGWSAIALGDYAGAEQALARALTLAPDDPEAGALHAWALVGQARLDEAHAACHRVLAREPAYALARVSLGCVHLQRRAYGEAIEQLAIALRDAAGRTAERRATLYATFYLGLAYLHRAMYVDAVAYFRRALALGPNLVQAHYELGRAHWLGGDRAAAEEAWRAGAAAGNFNPWGARCSQVGEVVAGGGEPPPLAGAGA